MTLTHTQGRAERMPPSLSADDRAGSSRAENVRAVLLLLLWGAVVRVAFLVAIHLVTHGGEINDDYTLYEAMVRRPFMLITGHGVEELGEGGIYAPLVPLQLWFPAKLWSAWTGPVLGRRLGMLAYDLVALAIALRVAFRVAGTPHTRTQWCAALLLAILPASVGASVVWGQEDTAAAVWSAAALACFVISGPLPAMLVAGAGLFTSKLFVVVLMLGIWLATPKGQRRRIALAGVACVAVFAMFLLLRWLASGFLYPQYHYNAMSNSPSVWALYYLLVRADPTDESIRIWVKVLVVVAMLVFLACVWRATRVRQLPVWATVVAAHCAFFASFIGIHPEHYQWFLPFLIVFAWDAFRRRRRAAFTLAVAVTYLGYAYKVVYGLRWSAGYTEGGKRAIREIFEHYVGVNLFWVQLTLLLAMLASLVLLTREALRFDVGSLAADDGPPRTTPAAT